MLEGIPVTLNFQYSNVVGEISLDSNVEACLKKGEQFVITPTLERKADGKMKVIGVSITPVEMIGPR